MLFAAGNLFVSAFIGGFLWRLGENWKLKRWFYYVIVVMVVGLIGLSFCPLGICDFDGKISTVSWLHQIFSRLMFVMMLLTVMIIVWQQRAGVVARMVGGFFVVYGIVCAMGMMCHQSWFEQRVLIYETLYFMFFYGVFVNLATVGKEFAGVRYSIAQGLKIVYTDLVFASGVVLLCDV